MHGPPSPPMLCHPHPHPGSVPLPSAAQHQPRLTSWDVVCTVALWAVLVAAAAAGMWLSLFFGFAADTCPTDGCPPVPLSIDEWVYPVTWGGIGVALALAVIGPFVSLWRRWYMLIWPAIGIGIVIASWVAGFAMTAYSQTYW